MFLKKITHAVRSFQARVTMVLVLGMLFVGLIYNIVIFGSILSAQFEQLRDKLKIIARTAALTIDPVLVASIPLNRDGIYTPQYKTVSDTLRKIKEENAPIRFIYILTQTPTPGVWQFVADPDPVQKRRSKITAYPGDTYNASRFPEMLNALNNATADKKFEIDEWGVTISGYAPIRDRLGKTIAVLGVDILASDVYMTRKKIFISSIMILLAGISISLLFGTLFSHRITGPIEELVEGTRRVSKGDLKYKVPAKGVDEISELATSFNAMADALYSSQQKNRNYFYDIIQSLVRIVEAKDPYTRGHSERVAEYAAQVAARMGFGIEQVEMIKETAMIHDIGKLGIQDSILNKKEKLTEEEWEIIRRHPLIGEEIIKPVSLNQEILTTVRNHHERFDGTGYPDSLKGDNIHMFAQILSVVDAYDAMVSSRAYRQAMSRVDAIEELRKHRGTQFNPLIIDIFIQIVREEDSEL